MCIQMHICIRYQSMKNDQGFERERGGNLWANLEESKEKKKNIITL